jgi:hypothetical protein
VLGNEIRLSLISKRAGIEHLSKQNSLNNLNLELGTAQGGNPKDAETVRTCSAVLSTLWHEGPPASSSSREDR